MYYYNSKPTELEIMLMEFLEFKKSGAPQAGKAGEVSATAKPVADSATGPDIGKGWPHYKGYAAELQKNAAGGNGFVAKNSPEATAGVLSFTPIAAAQSPQWEDILDKHSPMGTLPPADPPQAPNPAHTQPSPAPELPVPTGYSAPERHAHKENDLDYAFSLMGEISSSLMPHVIEAINEQEFSGSPIFEGQIYRERLHQMVERALALAAQVSPEVAEVARSSCGCRSWQRTQILRALVEALIIGELYLRRRPIYRKLLDSGWSHSEVL